MHQHFLHHVFLAFCLVFQCQWIAEYFRWVNHLFLQLLFALLLFIFILQWDEVPNNY
jgi:hypothetical protein